ncbi:MAG: hypothetical protein M1837_003730 [Sclerophora amabilis]|nr:MAG: hypothetical protein M1837_003730 [Sclerophora amabilis]
MAELALTVVFFLLTKGIYRLYFSPLAKFPGPKLAALTRWYEAWFDIVKGGRYTFKIRELHINDPEYHEELYGGARSKRDKYEWATKLFVAPQASIATVSHEQHRLRRSALSPFFSKASIRRLEPIVQGLVDTLLSRLDDLHRTGTVVNMDAAYAALTNDVITEYAFARSGDHLRMVDFNLPQFQTLRKMRSKNAVRKHLSWSIPIVKRLPHRIALLLNPGLIYIFRFQEACTRQVQAILNGSEKKSTPMSHATIFHEILNSKLPDSEKTLDRLRQEGQVVIFAGTETTAWCLSLITFHLLSNPTKVQKLREELETAIPILSESPSWEQLEQLPYLTAVINEGLRLAPGAGTRLQRISPDQIMKFSDGNTEWEIPAGTPVGMSSYLLHTNEEIFSRPYEFIPERWLDKPELERYLVPFSKGSRRCLGMNLAFAELYLCLANVFRRYGCTGAGGPCGKLELYHTDYEDVELKHDYHILSPKADSKGIRVLIT